MSVKNLGAVAAAAAVVALVVAACTTTNAPAGTVDTATPVATVAAPPPQDSSVAPTSTAPSTYGIGDRIKLGDEEYFAVTDVDLSFKGTSVFKPPAGKDW